MVFLRSNLSKLLLYLVTVFLLAAFFTPWIYAWGKDLAAYTAEHETFQGLEWFGEKCRRAQFDRYFKRALLFCALILLFPLIFWIRACSSKKTSIAIGLRSERWFRDFVFGFLLALLNFILVAYVGISKNHYSIRDNTEWLELIPSALFTALVVSLLEEVLFRGYMQQVLARAMSWRPMIFWTAFIFAFVHFSQPPKGIELDGDVCWYSGLYFLWESLVLLFSLKNILASFACLLGIGLILSYARWASGSLWISIGLHAGWISCYKVFTQAYLVNPFSEYSFIFGKSIREGLFTFALLMVVLGTVIYYIRRHYHERTVS